jgi:hypothetical protein
MTNKDVSYAIVRSDVAPRLWWDGYYDGETLAAVMSRYWTEELGVPCYAMLVSYPLPESGYHTNNGGHCA